ncbi:oxysterol-binding protein-related protein 6 [Aplysia californica]|uniref:Oxysterol-binding protein n=1 Tax=Aplysia californica TaxID=6500 RepID=A0ABM1VVT3_APLCA|nr:oxysterol-binding protein-related protein 6 [Aplysia californica]
MSLDTTRKPFRHSDTASDSDGSEEDSVSLASSLQADMAGAAAKVPKKRTNSRKARQEWEIVEGLKDGQKCEEKPDRHQGYLMKRRKWPMKGWHKRFFVLERGILTYAKSSADIPKGKYHGIIDIGLAVITFKRQGQRIDIDAEEQVHHIKVKDKTVFDDWLKRLRHHRLYRQHEIAYGPSDSKRIHHVLSPTEEIPPLTNANLPELALNQSLKKDIIRQSSFKGGQGRVMTWLLDSAGYEQCGKNIQSCKSELRQLRDLLEQIQSLPISADSGLESQAATPSGQTTPTSLLQSPPSDRLHSSASNPNLLLYTNGTSSNSSPGTNISAAPAGYAGVVSAIGGGNSARRQLSGDGAVFAAHESRIQDIRVRENFVSKAELVHTKLKDLASLMESERERLRNILDQDGEAGQGQQISALKHSLLETQKQNVELRSRLARIHADSVLPEMVPTATAASALMSPLPSMRLNQDKANLAQSLSLDSFSMSEYYDAEDNIETISESSSEPSDEEVSSEISEDGNDTDYNTGGVSEMVSQSICATGRRTKLPVPKPESPDVSLWNLLYRNIGKDLTKISMPVTLNEPLSMLQRLCEELEYSELLDKAADYDDPYERMIYVAAYAVSGYASSYYREGHKPFNPLLGETYECIREDKGWRFIAEQVSHHPPVTACHCDSRNFTLWQDVRMKTKFWGKSMEIQPLGHVHVILPKYRDHYKWNKVTTCVHNLLGGQRWADQYGEMTITNNNIVCKLTFTKGSNHRSPKRYEVFGSIQTAEGKVVHNLFGKWNEAFFCGHASSARCIWRPGAMPENHELYYGFTRFAIELNELDPDMSKYLPPTDSRFRPDQRLLEEGKITEAEAEKNRLENAQRERRKIKEGSGEDPQPMWFKKKLLDAGKTEAFEYDKKYWEARKDPGFARMSFVHLF